MNRTLLTVKELRDKLATYPDDHVVVLARDEEGNGYSPWRGITDGVYEDRDLEFTEPNINPNAVCLWPRD